MIKRLHIYFLPSIIELIIIFFLSFQLKYPVESGYLLWQHIVLGEMDIKSGHIVTQNPFSYLPSRPLKRSSWLADDIFYILYRNWGYQGVIVTKIFILILLFYLPFLFFKVNPLSYILVLPVYILLVLPGTALRPNLFALLLFLFVVYGFYKNDIKVMSFATFVWSFLHGSYVIGICLIAVYILFEVPLKSLLKFIPYLALSAVPLFLPHSGFIIYKNLASQSYVLRGMEEWLPLDIKSFLGVLTIIYSVIVAYVIVHKIRISVMIADLILLFMSIAFRRFLPFYAIFTFPQIVSHSLIKKGNLLKYEMEIAKKPGWIVAIMIYALFRPPSFRTYFVGENHPFGCEEEIRKLPEGSRVLSRQAWVPYLYFATGGRYKFSVDATLSQTDSIIRAYFDFLAQRSPCTEVLNILRPDYILFPTDSLENISRYCKECLKIEHIYPECSIWRNRCNGYKESK